MELSHVNTVLFDFDGTLLDSNELIADSWRHTVRSLAGREMTDDEIRATFGEILAYSMGSIMPDVDVKQAVETYRTYQHEIFLDRIDLFEGAVEMLHRLKSAGFKTAIVTSRLKSSTERALAHFGLEDFFDAVLTASDTDKFKPDPTPLFIILDRLGSKPGEAVFVGDTVHDIQAGKNAGVFTVLVDFSFALPPWKRAEAPAPDAVIKELKDILKLLCIKEI